MESQNPQDKLLDEGRSPKKRQRKREPELRSCAVRLVRLLLKATTLEALCKTVSGPALRSPVRTLFPVNQGDKALVVGAALELAQREAFLVSDLGDDFEFESLFRLVRAIWKALRPSVSRHDLKLADSCLGAGLVFLVAVLLVRRSLLPDDPQRLDNLALSLEARWREVWSRTRQAEGEDLFQAAVRESRFLSVMFRPICDGATLLHERIAAIALALQELAGDAPFLLPQERIALVLGHPRQRTGELIERLIEWGILAVVSEHDWKTKRATSYRLNQRRLRKACLVNRQ